MRDILQNRWFQPIHLLLALLGGVIWYFKPQAGAWPLLIVLLPWAAYIAAGQLHLLRSVFDLPLALFLLTAMIGVWTAYQREVAFAKFWVIVAAIFIYYAVSKLSIGNSWFLSGFLSLTGLAIGSYFLLTHDWQLQPNELISLNQFANKWTFIRPNLDLAPLDHNQAGGILAMCLPFPVAWMGRAWRENKRFLAFGALGISLILIFILLMTSSNSAWLASIIGFGIWFLWEVSAWVARSVQKSRSVIFVLLLLMGIGIPILILILEVYWGSFAFLGLILEGILPGSRLPLFIDTLHLIDDFSILGGGLGSFPGLYSHYIKYLPFYYLGYSHNLYLDVTLEQGIFGLLSLVIIYFGSAWLLINHLRGSHSRDISYVLNWAILVSLIILILQGLLDDPLYGEKGTPLIFVLSGLSVASTQSSWVRERSRVLSFLNLRLGSSLKLNRRVRLLIFSLIVPLLALFIGLAKPLLAELYSNLGSIQMARTELSAFPTKKWVEDTDISNFQIAKQWFERSLALDPNNKTSHYRLGLIAMRARDYQNSQNHLEIAHASDFDHPGLSKCLGYSYLWSGKMGSGAQLLKEIPEAKQELMVYIDWWKDQGDLDLSNRAISATLLIRMINVIDQVTSKK